MMLVLWLGAGWISAKLLCANDLHQWGTPVINSMYKCHKVSKDTKDISTKQH